MADFNIVHPPIHYNSFQLKSMSYPAQAVLAGERLLLSGSAHLLTHPKQVHFLDEDYRHGNFRELLAIEGTQLRSPTTACQTSSGATRRPVALPGPSAIISTNTVRILGNSPHIVLYICAVYSKSMVPREKYNSTCMEGRLGTDPFFHGYGEDLLSSAVPGKKIVNLKHKEYRDGIDLAICDQFGSYLNFSPDLAQFGYPVQSQYQGAYPARIHIHRSYICTVPWKKLIFFTYKEYWVGSDPSVCDQYGTYLKASYDSVQCGYPVQSQYQGAYPVRIHRSYIGTVPWEKIIFLTYKEYLDGIDPSVCDQYGTYEKASLGLVQLGYPVQSQYQGAYSARIHKTNIGTVPRKISFFCTNKELWDGISHQYSIYLYVNYTLVQSVCRVQSQSQGACPTLNHRSYTGTVSKWKIIFLIDIGTKIKLRINLGQFGCQAESGCLFFVDYQIFSFSLYTTYSLSHTIMTLNLGVLSINHQLLDHGNYAYGICHGNYGE